MIRAYAVHCCSSPGLASVGCVALRTIRMHRLRLLEWQLAPVAAAAADGEDEEKEKARGAGSPGR